MRWPWKRAEAGAVEERSYTDMRLQALQAQVGGTGKADPGGVAAVQAAANTWGRALASARVEPDTPATRAVTAHVRYQIGRALVLGGEAVFALSASRGMLTAIQASDWDVYGLEAWRYRLTIAGPSGTTTRRTSAAGVLHPRINVDPAQPHRGVSPIAAAGLTAQLAGQIESKLRSEASGLTGYVLPANIDDLDDDTFADLKRDVESMGGSTAMVPMIRGAGVSEGAPAGGSSWQPRRLGMNAPGTTLQLRSDAAQAVLGACGIPNAVIAGAGVAAGGNRESWRQFLHGTIQPVADMVSEELSAKLDTEVSFNFDRLFASDVMGRARAFNSLIGAGMETQEARRVAGV